MVIKKRKLSKENAYAMAWRRQKAKCEAVEALLAATAAELEATKLALLELHEWADQLCECGDIGTFHLRDIAAVQYACAIVDGVVESESGGNHG